VQELCLETYLYRQEIKSINNKTNDFEQQLMIHRPEVYEKYMEDKQEREEAGYDQIIWKAPESIEEFEYIVDIIEKNNNLLKEQENNIVENGEQNFSKNEVSVEENFIKQFEGIDISQLTDFEE